MRATNTRFDLTPSLGAASRVRREIARLFGAPPARRIILAPGMLSALRQLFSALDIEHLLLTTDEYYAARHFPELRVQTVPMASLLARVKATNPGAVIASLVSFHGKPLPVGDLFAAIRRDMGARAPLLVADYTHAGAIGFPPVADLNADVVGGDPEKWLMPPLQSSRLAFLWTKSPGLFRTVARTFSPLFLAVEGRTDARSSRWIDPEEMHAMAAWLVDARLTRRALVDRHRANLAMRGRIAAQLGIDAEGPASVLWTDRKVPALLAARLARQGLLWRSDTGRTRILCRTDR